MYQKVRQTHLYSKSDNEIMALPVFIRIICHIRDTIYFLALDPIGCASEIANRLRHINAFTVIMKV